MSSLVTKYDSQKLRDNEFIFEFQFYGKNVKSKDWLITYSPLT